jgi:transcription antitermination factor NusG
MALPCENDGMEYSAGDRVRVVSEAFEGCSGVVIGPSDSYAGKLNVAVDVLGRWSPVVLDPDELEPRDAPGAN